MSRLVLAPLILLAFALLAACGGERSAEAAFEERLRGLCGEAFEGRIVSTDEIDDSWRAERIVMHVASCRGNEIRIPLHVGQNRSRTWVLTRQSGQMTLSHDHRRRDGSRDPITDYGGTVATASPARVEFPASASTQDMFVAERIPESVDNVWALEVRPQLDIFAYEMAREGRFFRIEFDTANPVEPPPAPWGSEDAEG